MDDDEELYQARREDELQEDFFMLTLVGYAASRKRKASYSLVRAAKRNFNYEKAYTDAMETFYSANGSFDDEKFKRNYRLSFTLFEELCEKLFVV